MRGNLSALSKHRLAGKLQAPAPSTRHRRSRALKGDERYKALWRIVDGAVRDAFANHPDYLSAKGARLAQESIVKRVVGAVHSQAAQAGRGQPETVAVTVGAAVWTAPASPLLNYWQRLCARLTSLVARTNSRGGEV